MNIGPMRCLLGGLLLTCLAGQACLAQINGPFEFGFNRILPGWTNYSTAFNLTHDSAVDGEYATVASFYTPPVDVRVVEFSAVVVWYGTGGQRFAFDNFTFQIHCWSGLEAFVQNSRLGDVATMSFPAPTAGGDSPDTVTRGGRPAYRLRFDLTGASLNLMQCHEYLVGIAARAASPQAGELYVPTAPHEGMSDVQAGNVVPFGWQYLLNAGGQTIYSGQLATALAVQAMGEVPRLSIERGVSEMCLSWPASSACYTLESSEDLAAASSWSAVVEVPLVEVGMNRLCLPTEMAGRWFRLRKEAQSRFNLNGAVN